MFRFVIYLILLVSNSYCGVIDTSHGKVSGRVQKTFMKGLEYVSFQGIPFAAPPVKNLRFLPPQPIEPWEGVLSATKEKPACIQSNNNIKRNRLGLYGSEDCLYLDIFTPKPDDGKRAVIVYVFNDQFINSYNKSRDYAPDFFVEQDVVFVTISHRLTLFGFLSFEKDILLGNSGLKDLVVGLEWVKDNIERFGGDSNRITLMGSQGGATAVDLLIHSKAKGLFNSAILQSGTSWASAYLQNNARERALQLGEVLEIPTKNPEKLLRELQQTPAADLLAKKLQALPTDYFKETQKGLLAFGPIIENSTDGLIREYPENSEGITIPIMIGFNSREGLEPSIQYLVEHRYLSFVEKDFGLLMPIRLNLKFDPYDKRYYDAVQEIKDYYFNGKVTIRKAMEYVMYIGDLIKGYPIDRMVRAYSKRADVYYYYFDFVGELNENKLDIMNLTNVEINDGAATGDELCYLFKCPRMESKYTHFLKPGNDEYEVHDKLIRMWTNFAKYGNPTPPDAELDLKWLPYTGNNKEYLHITNKMEMKTDLLSERFNFWDQFINKWQSVAVNGVIGNKHDEL